MHRIKPAELLLNSFTFPLDRYFAVRWGRGRHRQGPDGQSREERREDHTARRLCHCRQVWRARHHRHCDRQRRHPLRLDGETAFRTGKLDPSPSRQAVTIRICSFRVWTVDQRAPRPTPRPWPGPSRSCGTAQSECLNGTTLPRGQRVWWTTWWRWPKKAALPSSVRKSFHDLI